MINLSRMNSPALVCTFLLSLLLIPLLSAPARPSRAAPVASRPEAAGAALARARYPGAIAPEIGANDIRISDMGGDPEYFAGSPTITYNATNNEYFVVWLGKDNTPPMVDGDYEIFGQRLDATSGAEIGADIRLSDAGPDGVVFHDVLEPAVAWNSTNNEYLVVWASKEDGYEIYGQRVSAGGTEVGANDIRLSDMGPDGTADFDAFDAAVAYNALSNEYLVVWTGDDNTSPLVNDENEIFGQRLSATGVALGTNDFRISEMGVNGVTNATSGGAATPAITWNSTANEYLVVWRGSDNLPSLDPNESEIYGQRLSPTGVELGSNDFRISDMGIDGNLAFIALAPALAYNPTRNEYLVVWFGSDNAPTLSAYENEIFGQRLSASGVEAGANDFRISAMGPDGNTDYRAWYPTVAYNPTDHEYLVAWEGREVTAAGNKQDIFGQRLDAANGSLLGFKNFPISDTRAVGLLAYTPVSAYNPASNEYLVAWSGTDFLPLPASYSDREVYAQRLAGASAAEVGANDARISTMGQIVDLTSDAFQAAIAYNSADNEYFVVWYGDDTIITSMDDKYEVFGRRVDAATGAILGPKIRLSQTEQTADFDGTHPAIAYNSLLNEYLVVWQGDSGRSPLVDDELEIFGQRVSASGAETGINDFRISDMGTDGSSAFTALAPAVAYNGANNSYLVVWTGEDNSGTLVDNEYEVFGQVLSGNNGAEIGANDFRISDMGPAGNTGFVAFNPALAYNSAANEYLVVWSGTDNTPPLVQFESEIFGQRLNADGGEVGADDVRLSDMGPDGDTNFNASTPALAYNSVANEYFVVWQGFDDTPPQASGEAEIFGQRLSASGVALGTNDIRLSDMGPAGNAGFLPSNPAVAYDAAHNEYLVAWQSDDAADNEEEIFGQAVSAGGLEVGTNDARLSDMGPDGDSAFDAANPAIAWSGNAYFVIWEGDDNAAPQVDEEFEIFGQYVSRWNQLSLPLLIRRN